MTSPILELIAEYAKRRKFELPPNWSANAPKTLECNNAEALNQISIYMGWNATFSRGKPRVHELPMLTFHQRFGWGIIESWLDRNNFRMLTISGDYKAIEWSEDCHFWSIIFPEIAKIENFKRALDVFWSAIIRRKSMIIDAVIATIVINIIALATSIYSMQVYDRVIPQAGFATLAVLTAGMVFALLIDMLIRYTRATMIDREAGIIDSEISEFFYARMQAVRLDARPRSIGTMAAQLRGTDQVRSLLSSASVFVVADLPFAILFMVFMGWIGGIVALVPLVAFPLSLILACLFARLIRSDTAAAQVTGNRKNGQLVEALDSVETIKANLGGWHMLASWNRLVDEVHGHDLKVKRWSILSSSGFSLIQQLAYVGVVCVGAFQVAKGNMTMGSVIACSILSGRVNGPLISALPSLIVQWGYARSSLAALDSVLTMPSDQPHDRQLIKKINLRGRIAVENAKFAHHGGRQSVILPKLTIQPGERIGIIGPVGSGKSTLLKLLSGLYAPQEGHIMIDGVEMRQIVENDLRSQVCYFPQDYRLITGSLRDNLVLGLPTPSDEALLEAASKTGLSDLIDSHPMGLDLLISEGGMGLSGGQRVQVGVTRLLLVKPKVLLLDEPTANLDQESEARILKAMLQAIGVDCTLILVTHKTQILSLVQRLLVLANGQVVLDGPTHSVLNTLRTETVASRTAQQITVKKG